jgi:hypothetical protein
VQKVAKAPAKQRAAGKSKTGRSKASAKVPTYQAHLVTACLVFSPCGFSTYLYLKLDREYNIVPFWIARTDRRTIIAGFKCKESCNQEGSSAKNH